MMKQSSVSIAKQWVKSKAQIREVQCRDNTLLDQSNTYEYDHTPDVHVYCRPSGLFH